MARITEMHKKWLKAPKYKKAYDALEEEFVLAGAVMDVRNRAGLTQEELARRMGTTQPVVARLESGRTTSVHADTGAPGEGNRISLAHQLCATGSKTPCASIAGQGGRAARSALFHQSASTSSRVKAPRDFLPSM